MGNRANFGFKQFNGRTIMLYGHWAGHNMMNKFANALAVAEPRWSDDAYGTRIAVSQLVGEDWDQELGWGLLVDEIADNEHSIPIFDFYTKTVSLYDEAELRNIFKGLEGSAKFSMDIKSFIKKFQKN